MKEPDWIECPNCKNEVSGLPDGKKCWNCCYESDRRQKWSAERRAYIKQVLDCENPERFIFKDLQECHGNKEAIAWARTFNPSLDNAYFWGHNGAGKSFLAKCMLVKWINEGMTGRVLTAEKLRDELTGITGAEKQDKIQEFSELDVLVIDEIGLGSNSDFLVSAICNVINARESREKDGLIVTSNLSIDSLADYFGSRHITSRLEHICKVVQLCPKDDKGRLIDWRLMKGEGVRDYKQAAGGNN